MSVNIKAFVTQKRYVQCMLFENSTPRLIIRQRLSVFSCYVAKPKVLFEDSVQNVNGPM